MFESDNAFESANDLFMTRWVALQAGRLAVVIGYSPSVTVEADPFPPEARSSIGGESMNECA